MEPIPAGAAPWREVFRGARGRLVIGLVLLETLAAIHMLVVAAVMPAVLVDLGHLPLYGWSFTAASLALFGSIPVAGAAVDRFGARRLLVVVALIYLGGLLVSALAPSMQVLIAGRFLQGAANGAAYALSIGAVAKSLPTDVRPRVLALLATAWLLPGLVGPPLGALLASTVGWRWAFVVPIPLLILSVALVLPLLDDAGDPDAPRPPVLRSIALMLGAGVLLAGLGDPSIRALAPILVGGAVTVVALRGLVPPGTFAARRGMPAAALAALLLSIAFVAADSYTPLMLTNVRGTSVLAAGLALTFAAVAWALGSWWQSRRANRVRASTLVLLGDTLLVAGIVAVVAVLTGGPLALAYVGWAVAGFGMGVAYPTVPLAVMARAEEGREAAELAPVLLMDMLGIAAGAGLGGVAIALSVAKDAPVRSGIAGAFAVAIAAALALLLVCRRIDPPA
ncbi:MAG TPA: MFS transporter [Actinomycetota bacterium]|nr:MFS transporter [Actinomycetota bacterium]